MSNGYLKKKLIFQGFRGGMGGSNIFQGGGGSPNANFYRNPLFPPLNPCMIYKLVFAPTEDLDQTASLQSDQGL